MKIDHTRRILRIFLSIPAKDSFSLIDIDVFSIVLWNRNIAMENKQSFAGFN